MTLLAAWLLLGPWFSPWVAGVALQLGGALLGVWAVLTMVHVQRRMFPVSPVPPRDGRLVTRGPYRWIRHPMYTALLLVVLPAAFAGGRATLAIGLALAATLVLKLTVEERLLRQRFPDYDAYRRTTWALLPPIL